jgi:hypothetical protein
MPCTANEQPRRLLSHHLRVKAYAIDAAAHAANTTTSNSEKLNSSGSASSRFFQNW